MPKPEENVVANLHSQTIEWEKRDTGGVHSPTRVAEKKATCGAGDGLKVVDVSNANFRIPDTPSGFSGEHAAAGWPSWLTAVAGEAIKGWLPRRSGSFEKLAKVGTCLFCMFIDF